MKRSHWQKSSTLPEFGRLDRDIKVDVAVVGGGMTGISAAYLIKRKGKSVALLERGRIASVDTAHTTAHLTYVTDARLSELINTVGDARARALWDAGAAAMDQIYTNVIAENIDCDFRWVPAYLHVPLDVDEQSEIPGLKEDARLARQLDFEATFMSAVPLVKRSGVLFPNQAKFHPLKYLAGLVRTIPGDGCYVFEDSEVTEFEESPLRLKVGSHTVTCEKVIIATHVPLTGVSNVVKAALFQTKLAAYTSYAVGGRIPNEKVQELLLWDTADPYSYLRVDQQGDSSYAILGGNDHKTGQLPEENVHSNRCCASEEGAITNFTDLEGRLRKLFPNIEIDSRWSGQVIETHDGMPYIGAVSDEQFIATGYSGNGMTFGTVAAMMARDYALGVDNMWSDLFRPSRVNVFGSVWECLKENADYPYYMTRDRLASASDAAVESLQPGEGRIVRIGGDRVAAFRNEGGELTLLSPVCPHMGCLVHWNPADCSWDCPCHGSRFSATGQVISGPAESSLAPHEASDDGDSRHTSSTGSSSTV